LRHIDYTVFDVEKGGTKDFSDKQAGKGTKRYLDAQGFTKEKSC
jgi:hypothetical protein